MIALSRMHWAQCKLFSRVAANVASSARGFNGKGASLEDAANEFNAEMEDIFGPIGGDGNATLNRSRHDTPMPPLSNPIKSPYERGSNFVEDGMDFLLQQQLMLQADKLEGPANTGAPPRDTSRPKTMDPEPSGYKVVAPAKENNGGSSFHLHVHSLPEKTVQHDGIHIHFHVHQHIHSNRDD